MGVPAIPSSDRAFVAAYGPDDDAIQLGVRWLLRRAAGVSDTDVGLFVPTLNNADSLAGALGIAGATALRRDRRLTISAVSARLLTERGLPGEFPHPILAVWVDDDGLARLERLNQTGLCVVPWRVADIEHWLAAHNPPELRSGQPAGRTPTISNPVAGAAMIALTHRVNLSTGLGHPSDRDAAIGAFRALSAAGELFDPDEIRAWATAHGWRADHADHLAQVADAVREGRRLRTHGTGGWRDDIVELWRADTAVG